MRCRGTGRSQTSWQGRGPPRSRAQVSSPWRVQVRGVLMHWQLRTSLRTADACSACSSGAALPGRRSQRRLPQALRAQLHCGHNRSQPPQQTPLQQLSQRHLHCCGAAAQQSRQKLQRHRQTSRRRSASCQERRRCKCCATSASPSTPRQAAGRRFRCPGARRAAER